MSDPIPSNIYSRRDILKMVGAAVGHRTIKSLIGPPPVSTETGEVNPAREFVFSVEEGARVGEPAVVVAEGKLIVAAVADKAAEGKNLPLHIWVADIGDPDKVQLKKVEVDGYTTGSDPVIQYLPEVHKVVVFSLAARENLLLMGIETRFVESVYDLETGRWQKKDDVDFVDDPPFGADKPWFVWREGRGWLTFVEPISTGGFPRVKLYSCGTDLKFTRETFTLPDGYYRGFPLALPDKDGRVHLISRRMVEPIGNSADITEMIYDPNTKHLSEELKIISCVFDSGRERHLERKWMTIANLNGLITPQGGIIITVPDKDGVALGYLGSGKTSWKVEKLVPKRFPREHLGVVGFANPFVAGGDTVGIRFFAEIYSTTGNIPTRYVETYFVREQGGTLSDFWPATDYMGTSARNEQMERKAEVGDYIQVVSDILPGGGVPIVTIEDHAIKVKLYPPVPVVSDGRIKE